MAQRLTFRDKITSEAWQHKIRVEKEREWIESGKPRFWESLDLDLKKAVVREVNRQTAEKIILEYEWLGDMAVTDKYYGIFFDQFCAGVICIHTKGVSIPSSKHYGLTIYDISYFARGACVFWSPKGTASKLLSVVARLEKKRGAKMCIGFADTDAGEYGTIYQACNWLCIGKLPGQEQQFVKGNKVIGTRTLCTRIKNSPYSRAEYIKRLKQSGWREQRGNSKYRYINILADEPERSRIYNRIKNNIIPYPKRV